MKICINALLVQSGVTGGGETFLVNLVERLARFDKRNHYLVLTTAQNRELFDHGASNLECRVVFNSSRSKAKRLLFENLILPFYLLRHGVDLYYSPFGTLPLFLFCHSAVTFQNLIYLDFRKNVPYRGRSFKSRLSVYLQALYHKIITPLTLRRADLVWAVSHTTAEELRRRYKVKRTKLAVISEGVEFNHFNPAMRGADVESPFDFPYIVTVASLYPNKNIDKLIRAFALVKQRGVKHKLVIIGPDWHDYGSVLRNLVRKLSLDDSVIFTGAVPHCDLPPYLWGADLFLLLSNVESFGLPVLEAMAAGVPVIISNKSSLPEIAADAAVVASISSDHFLARRMIEVLTSRKLSSTLRQRGVMQARRFDWDETAVRAIDLFNRMSKEFPEVDTLAGG